MRLEQYAQRLHEAATDHESGTPTARLRRVGRMVIDSAAYRVDPRPWWRRSGSFAARTPSKAARSFAHHVRVLRRFRAKGYGGRTLVVLGESRGGARARPWLAAGPVTGPIESVGTPGNHATLLPRTAGRRRRPCRHRRDRPRRGRGSVSRPGVHPTAVVGPDVTLGDDVILHPYVVVLGTVHLGAGTEVFPGAVIGKPPAIHPTLSRPVTRGPVGIGAGCSIGAHAVLYEDVELGAETLVGDLASIREGTRIGRRCVIGRLVTVHTAVTVGDGSGCSTTPMSRATRRRRRLLPRRARHLERQRARPPPVRPGQRVRGPRIDDGAAIGSARRCSPASTSAPARSSPRPPSSPPTCRRGPRSSALRLAHGRDDTGD